MQTNRSLSFERLRMEMPQYTERQFRDHDKWCTSRRFYFQQRRSDRG